MSNIPPSTPESSPFTHLDTMIAALAEQTEPKDRRLFLRGIIRGLELVVGQVHARLGALVDALTEKEGK